MPLAEALYVTVVTYLLKRKCKFTRFEWVDTIKVQSVTKKEFFNNDEKKLYDWCRLQIPLFQNGHSEPFWNRYFETEALGSTIFFKQFFKFIYQIYHIRNNEHYFKWLYLFLGVYQFVILIFSLSLDSSVYLSI